MSVKIKVPVYPLDAKLISLAFRSKTGLPSIPKREQLRCVFVIRHKSNLAFTTIKERELPENRSQHVLIDQKIELINQQSMAKIGESSRE